MPDAPSGHFGFTRRSASPQSAFTLIELMISAALMSIILAAAYICLSGGISSQRMIESRSDALQGARVALALMAADLRSAVPLSKQFEFLGMHREMEGATADNLDFGTRNYNPKHQHEFDFCEVSYYLRKDPATESFTLFRRRDPTPDPEPLAGGSREEIARGVRALRFEFYDGWDWYDDWGDPDGKKQTALFPEPNLSGLPEAVRITLTVDPAFDRKRNEDGQSPEPPLVLQTTACLNMSDFFYQSSGGSAGGSTNNAGANQGSAPQAGEGGFR